jgi:hypothetical protein
MVYPRLHEKSVAEPHQSSGPAQCLHRKHCLPPSSERPLSPGLPGLSSPFSPLKSPLPPNLEATGANSWGYWERGTDWLQNAQACTPEDFLHVSAWASSAVDPQPVLPTSSPLIGAAAAAAAASHCTVAPRPLEAAGALGQTSP